MAAESARQSGALQVVTASLVAHSWAAPLPDVCALVSDAFIIFPWVKQVLINGQWQPHPEIVAGLKHQQDINDRS